MKNNKVVTLDDLLQEIDEMWEQNAYENPNKDEQVWLDEQGSPLCDDNHDSQID